MTDKPKRPLSEWSRHELLAKGPYFPDDVWAELCARAKPDKTTSDYRSDAEWMATYILGRLPDHNTMSPTEIEDYEQKLEEIVKRVAAGIGKP